MYFRKVSVTMTAKQINTFWHIAIIFYAYRLYGTGILTGQKGAGSSQDLQ